MLETLLRLCLCIPEFCFLGHQICFESLLGQNLNFLLLLLSKEMEIEPDTCRLQRVSDGFGD
jgi:hypothetical protein